MTDKWTFVASNPDKGQLCHDGKPQVDMILVGAGDVADANRSGR
jgi:hypothetical protein